MQSLVQNNKLSCLKCNKPSTSLWLSHICTGTWTWTAAADEWACVEMLMASLVSHMLKRRWLFSNCNITASFSISTLKNFILIQNSQSLPNTHRHKVTLYSTLYWNSSATGISPPGMNYLIWNGFDSINWYSILFSSIYNAFHFFSLTLIWNEAVCNTIGSMSILCMLPISKSKSNTVHKVETRGRFSRL